MGETSSRLDNWRSRDWNLGMRINPQRNSGCIAAPLSIIRFVEKKWEEAQEVKDLEAETITHTSIEFIEPVLLCLFLLPLFVPFIV